jgi:ribosomal protein L22
MADKDEQQSPGSKGPKAEEAKLEAEATEAKAEAAEEKPAEEKPKPKRRTRAKKPAAAKAEKPEEAKEKADEEEAEAEAAEAEGEPEAEDETGKPKPAGRARRRGAEVTAGRTEKPKRRPRRDADGAPDITVRARAKYVRTAPRKARLVIDHIRGKDVDQARAILVHTPRAASRDVLKLLDSAIANAENNHDLVADDLKIGRVYVDEGPTLKRYRPRALGRATRIRKRTSHMTIELVSKE